MEKVLILGGNRFMGRLVTEALIDNDRYNVTLFNRGKTNPNLFPDVPKILGDRETDDIQKLFEKNWDFVIDFSGYHPDSLERLLDGMKGKVGRYVFISTVSVYVHNLNTIKKEDAPILKCTEAQKVSTKINYENYGPKKAECERVLMRKEWLDKIILRPAIVYGPLDYSDRLYYWLYRVKTMKRFIIPDVGQERMNMTYVGDLVKMILRALEVPKHQIIYNTTTHKPNTLLQKIERICIEMKKNPDYLFIPGEQIRSSLKAIFPLWTKGNHYRFDHSRIIEDFDIDLTPFPQSIRETVDWFEANSDWKEGSAGPRVADAVKFMSRF